MQLLYFEVILLTTAYQFNVFLAAYCRPYKNYFSYMCEGVRLKNILPPPIAKKNVVVVNIFDCKETELSENALPFLNLENLTLSCDIKDIDKNAFQSYNHLQELNLGNNTISTLPERVFESLRNLRTLNLTKNHFEHLPRNIFIGLDNLKQLIISNNALSGLDSKILDNTEQLEEIYLDHNEISFIPVTIFSKTRKLRYIDFSYNYIENLGDIFTPTYNLIYLNLSYNRIKEIPARFFQTTKMEVLDLSNNELSIVHEDSLPLASLLKLYLHNNKIFLMDLNGQSVSRIPLNLLDLQNNRLVLLDNDFIKKANSLITLNVEGNPWDCKCFEKMEILRGNLSLQLSLGYHIGEEPLCVVGYSDNSCNSNANNLTVYYTILQRQKELR